MKKGFSFFLLSLLFITPGCKDSKEIVNEYNVVPLPNQMVPQQGRFDLNKKVKVITTGCSPEVQSIADSLINRLAMTAGISLERTDKEHDGIPAITFNTQEGLPQEGYKL